jgi:hypothetical protein
MRRSFPAAFGIVLLLSGCASVFGTDEAATQIAASAPGAECVLNGEGYSQTIRTPAKVSPPLEASPVAISCSAPGFHTVDGELRALFDNRLIANLVFGSSLLVMVDLLNDRDRVYPERLAVFMEPAHFRNEATRDAWFGRFHAHVAEKWDRAIAERTIGCAEGHDGHACAAEIAALREARGRELAVLDGRRRAALVTGEAVAEETRLSQGSY